MRLVEILKKCLVYKNEGNEKFKIADALQAKLINNYKNTKNKQLKAKAAIWFNKRQIVFASNMEFSLKMAYITHRNM